LRSIKKNPVGNFACPRGRGKNTGVAGLRFSSSRHRDETIPYPTKSFCAFDANFLKPLSDNEPTNAPKTGAWAVKQGTYHAQS
jgi:hypothetical protein